MINETQKAIKESLTPKSENISTETKEMMIKGNPIAKYSVGTQATGDSGFLFAIVSRVVIVII